MKRCIACLMAFVVFSPSSAARQYSNSHKINTYLGCLKRLTVGGNLQDKIVDIDNGSGLTFEQDKPRYDQFASLLKKHPTTRAHIIVYGGRKGLSGEAKTRAECIKKYLVRKHSIDPKRIVTVDGGYRVEVAVELYALEPNQTEPPPVPVIDPSDVKVTNKKAKRGTCR